MKNLASLFSLLFVLATGYAQSDTLPIGVFDSGTGGLTILNTLVDSKKFNTEKFIYLADQANMPYGNYYAEKKTDLLIEHVIKDAKFLLSKDVKAIVIACNTATAYAKRQVEDYVSKTGKKIKVIGVIDAGAQAALEVLRKDEDGTIGVFATVGTVASGGYERTIRQMMKKTGHRGNIRIFNQGGYGLAEAVDGEPDYINTAATSPSSNYRGPSLDNASYRIDRTLLDVYNFDFDKNKMLCDSKNTDDCEVMQINSGDNYVRFHLVSLLENMRKAGKVPPMKALILGCTHYPYLQKEIRQTLTDLYNYQQNGTYVYRPYLVKDVQLIDPAVNVTKELDEYLHQQNLVNKRADLSRSEFYITVPNTDNKNIELDSVGRFTYAYKYGRKAGQNQEYVKAVPFSNTNISTETYGRFKDLIPSTSSLIDQYRTRLSISKVLPVIDSMFNAYKKVHHLPGITYSILYNGEVVHEKGLGYANIEKQYAADRSSAFRVASMSKSFIGVAILQLRDKGLLQLDDAAARYIPELKKQKLPTPDAPEITIRNLLTHSAGFPEDNPWGDRQLSISDSQMLAMFSDGISFSNTPGVYYEYSNMGYAMLGHIIKKVTGKYYADYVRDNILKPLGMNNSYFEYDDVPERKLSIGYRWLNGSWIKQPMLHDGAYGAMGGLISTMEDFAKYAALHLSAWPPSADVESPVLKKSSLREMQKMWQVAGLNTTYKYPDGRTCPTMSGYGYGLRWSQDCEGRIMTGHSGGLPGFGSNWTIMPDYGLGVITFANNTYAPTTMMNAAVLDKIIKLADLQPRPIPVSAILDQRKNELLKLLPDWSNAQSTEIFAVNFFDDYILDSLKKETKQAFSNAGTIRGARPMVAENNLRGYFILEGEKQDIRVYFTLSPENPALIQAFRISNQPKKK